ncbi:hypothetical protein GCM10009798_01170 [Nocardioides panacihumi]|uniref:Uncharacterized protein n=1 Tax=Nocardioides panacihumi TaxID=400774 RepID=A0ABN2Q746_9ACTN
MGVVTTIAIVLVAWCACALVVGVVVGRAISLKPRGGVPTPEPHRGPARMAPLSVSYRERL